MSGAHQPAMFDAIAEQLAAKILPVIEARMTEASQKPKPRLLNVEEAATYLGRTPSAVEHLIQEKKIVPVRIDRRVQIDLKDLDSLIDRSKDGAIS